MSVVALGLPFAVVVGWTLGTPAPAPPPASAPGGAGGLGAAPPRVTTPATSSVLDWSPRPPKPVSVESSLPGAPVASTAPSGSVPSVIITSGSPDPTLTLLPPVPTPTSIITTPPAPSATVPSASTDPDTSVLGAARLIRGS